MYLHPVYLQRKNRGGSGNLIYIIFRKHRKQTMRNLSSLSLAVLLLFLSILGCAKSDTNRSGTSYSTPKSFVSTPAANQAATNAASIKPEKDKPSNQIAVSSASASSSTDAATGSANLESGKSWDTDGQRPNRKPSGRGYSSAARRSSSGASSGEIVSPEITHSGATARCRDGSLSYRAHRRGTCSHHGGVSVWY